MPRHRKSAIGAAVEPAPPMAQNAAAVNMLGPHPTSHASVGPYGRQHGQQATSLPGDMSVIRDVQKPGKGVHGIPGIISTTTLGAEQRHRMVSGIIVSAMGGHVGDQGPVSRVQGVDSTAYNTGMVHIAGSRFK